MGSVRRPSPERAATTGLRRFQPTRLRQQRAGSTNPSDLGARQAAFAAFETAIDGMRQDSVPREVQGDALKRLFGFAVALEQIGGNLGFAHAPLSEPAVSR